MVNFIAISWINSIIILCKTVTVTAWGKNYTECSSMYKGVSFIWSDQISLTISALWANQFPERPILTNIQMLSRSLRIFDSRWLITSSMSTDDKLRNKIHRLRTDGDRERHPRTVLHEFPSLLTRYHLQSKRTKRKIYRYKTKVTVWSHKLTVNTNFAH